MDSNVPASAFTLFDMLAIGGVIACIAMSAMRGVMAEMIAFGGWLVSLLVARSLSGWLAEKAFPNLQPFEMATVISFVLIFVSMRVLLSLLNYILDYFIKINELTNINRFFGGVIGLFKGLLIVSLVVLVCSFTGLPSKESWQIAKTSRFFEKTAQLIAPTLPEFLKIQVVFPLRDGDLGTSALDNTPPKNRPKKIIDK